MKNLGLLTFALCLCLVKCFAQSTKRAEIPIGIEFYNHTIGTPFDDPFKNPFNIGAAITSSYPLMLHRHSKITIDGELGYYRHKELATGINLNTGITYTYTTGFGLYAAMGIPLGYVHTFNAYKLYKLNSDGEYEPKKDYGRSGVFAGYTLQLGYDLRKVSSAPIAIFVKNEFWLQTNYSKYSPSLLQNSLRVGVSFFPFHK